MEWHQLNQWTQASIIWAPVWVAGINMIGSVLIAWIRAKYQITEKANGTIESHRPDLGRPTGEPTPPVVVPPIGGDTRPSA